ncbi:type II toxin-antitoxin system RelE family toxin [Archaeoglobus neptunius]|uniref:type II toxin-antitoxin system RelE family toxin n=1 Tax=Archaeoglobus neptunius TaxID=2798580 RepID=UPI0019289523|nr:type II toxin-antitoxin system RelE/ParE family toxin [Archaeoglobus neptunius]
MKFEVRLSDRAIKDLKQFGKKDLERIFRTIERLENPFSLDIKKIKGEYYRIPVGKIRIIVKINFEKSIVLVVRVDWRKRIYDRL